MSRTSTSSSGWSWLSQSSSLASASPTHKLHRIAFQGEDSAHWAMLLPVKTGTSIGLIVHIGVQQEGPSMKPVRYRLLMHRFNVANTAAMEARVIPGAEITESQLKEAAEAVFYRKGNTYHMLTNNCQHFCIDVVTWLHYRYLESVSRDAIKDCEGKGTKPIALRKFIFWTCFTNEGRMAHARAKQATEAEEAATQPSIRTLNRSRVPFPMK